MYIGEDRTLVGYPIRKIRDVLATALEPPGELKISPFQDVLGLDKEAALEVAQSLEPTYLQPKHDNIFRRGRPPKTIYESRRVEEIIFAYRGRAGGENCLSSPS